MTIFDDYPHDGDYRVVEHVIDLVTVDELDAPEQRALVKEREQACKKVLANRIRPYGPDIIPKIKVRHHKGPFNYYDTPIEAGQVLVDAWAPPYAIRDELA